MARLDIIVIVFLGIMAVVSIIVLLIAIFELAYGRKAEKREIAKMEEFYHQPVELVVDLTSNGNVTINGKSLNPGRNQVMLTLNGKEASPRTSIDDELANMEGENRVLLLQLVRYLNELDGVSIRKSGNKFLSSYRNFTVCNLYVSGGVGRAYVYMHKKKGGGTFVRYIVKDPASVSTVMKTIDQSITSIGAILDQGEEK